ncbi:unnamed protein product, partial [Polarella glacialis]
IAGTGGRSTQDRALAAYFGLGTQDGCRSFVAGWIKVFTEAVEPVHLPANWEESWYLDITDAERVWPNFAVLATPTDLIGTDEGQAAELKCNMLAATTSRSAMRRFAR